MTMMFRQVKAALVTLLETAAAGRYRVFSSQAQGKSAEEFTGNNRTVRVYYDGGSFDKSRGAVNGNMDHDVRFNLELIVVEEAETDLSVLSDDSATAAERIAALSGSNIASDRADDSLDELAEIVYQVIMDARNQWFGMTKYSIGSRWISGISKNNVEPNGEYVCITGSLALTANVTEEITGETPIAGVVISGDILIKDDPEQKTGLEHDIT